MTKIKAGIVNVTGYIGAEIARLLHQHPSVELVSMTGRSMAGKNIGDVYPHLDQYKLLIETDLSSDVDVAFVAMPHKASVDVVPELLTKGIKVIDAGADFRLKDPAAYPRWYDFEHPRPDLLEEAVYGIPELHREQIASASLVANPGCYSTCAILALAPAIKAGLIDSKVIIDGKSGVSGAGRSLNLKTHYSEVNESLSAYSLDGHRHLPEILQELNLLNKTQQTDITFLPHLIPMTRGILNSCYAWISEEDMLSKDTLEENIRSIYRETYANAPFVKITDIPPATKHVSGSNYCNIYVKVNAETSSIIVLSCIDNLIKGGAGQAIQNMNLMFNLPETTGLDTLALYP